MVIEMTDMMRRANAAAALHEAGLPVASVVACEPTRDVRRAIAAAAVHEAGHLVACVLAM